MVCFEWRATTRKDSGEICPVAEQGSVFPPPHRVIYECSYHFVVPQRLSKFLLQQSSTVFVLFWFIFLLHILTCSGGSQYCKGCLGYWPWPHCVVIIHLAHPLLPQSTSIKQSLNVTFIDQIGTTRKSNSKSNICCSRSDQLISSIANPLST